MSFAHPWLLLGLLAAFIPLLVHLFDRRRPRPHAFPPLAFVLRSQKRTASRLKLRRLLLYVLRTFLLIAFPIALARPEWRREREPRVATAGPAAVAIVLDASFSMRYRDGETLFDKAKGEARSVVSSLTATEAATVYVCGLAPSPRRSPTLDKKSLLSDIDAAQVSYAAVDMARCLEAAAHVLEDSPLPAKRLVVVSAFTARAFPAGKLVPTLTGSDGKKIHPEVVLRDVAPNKALLPNHAVTRLQLQAAPQAGPKTYQLTFSIRNHSAEPMRDANVTLKVGDAIVSRGFVEVPPGGSVEKVFTHRFETSGRVQGEVALDADSLPDDDRQAFVLQVPADMRALLVNGAPSPVRHRDEAFFTEAALRAPGSPVQLAVRDTEAAWREDFQGYGLILLLNTEAPPPEVATRLQQFVEAGGGLLMALGDRVQADAYNARLGALLPRPLHELKTIGRPGESDEAAHLGDIQSRHPVFALFTGAAEEGLVAARFFRYFLLEPKSAGTSQVLAAFEDGAPALVLGQRGRGHVALWTSSLDRDWTDLPIRTAFLPLIQRLCAQLSGALEEREALRPRVGEEVALPLAGNDRIRTPSGAELTITSRSEGEAKTAPLPEPGVYDVRDPRGTPLPGLAFAASLDPTASDLTRISPDTLSRNSAQDVVVTSTQSAERASLPLWTWLLLAAALALFTEGLILRRA